MKEIPVSQIKGFKIGHAQDLEHATGCTAILCEQGAWAGVDVRGGSPASRETELLRPVNTVQQINCVMLSGGSAFGLEAGDGAMQFLEEKGFGFDTGFGKVPIVCGASLFDLELVTNKVRPDKAMGYAACVNACSGQEPAEGNVGAGCGATVGKLLGGGRAMKAGLGICGLALGELAVVAVVAVNALGNVRSADGAWIAGCRDGEGRVMDPLEAFGVLAQQAAAHAEQEADPAAGPCANTTIGVVLTNARLTKAQATKASSTVHDAYARAIKPVHTSGDGDTVFTFASGEVEADYDTFAILATEAMQGAVVRAVEQAEGAYGLPAARDLVSC